MAGGRTLDLRATRRRDELDDGNIQPDTGELIEQPANAIGLGHMARCGRRNELSP
jgi:hypothetical protein